MNVFLMYPERDLETEPPLPPQADELTKDLELNVLLDAMTGEDEFLAKVCKQVLFASQTDLETLRYRQRILQDCLNNADAIRALYQIPVDAMDRKRRHWLGVFSRYPSGILSGALEMMNLFAELFQRLRQIADRDGARFQSPGFQRFFAMIQKELNDDYLAEVREHLRELQFRDGALFSAELGRGNEGTNYILRKPAQQGWLKRALNDRFASYSFTLHPRDEHGARALAELKDRGVNLAANALAQAADHVEGFFAALRSELAFYVGCLNLSEKLAALGEPICIPELFPAEERAYAFEGLYDVCLALTMNKKTVGNRLNADGKNLLIVTGANQGGKSTFLRSVGLAQLMAQCGMFVPAESLRLSVCRGLFTHYRREEDSSMTSGKLDEELARMSVIVSRVQPDCAILFNESFAATNEREGSEIARQIISALLEKRVRVFFVTHLYELANGFYEKNLPDAVFLRAERRADGARTFKLSEGKPLPTSFGKDLYEKTFQE